MTPIRAAHVRNTFTMAPVTFPWDRYPKACVTLSEREETTTGYKYISYHIHSSNPHIAQKTLVTHLFTGNQAHLQQEPSELWLNMQKGDIPLAWQSVDRDLAAGEDPNKARPQVLT